MRNFAGQFSSKYYFI